MLENGPIFTHKGTCVLTGAGISVAAGIPTFNDRPELRNLFSLSFFNKDFKEFWKRTIELQESLAGKEPTTAHKLLAAQQDWRIITMNIDSLHEKAQTAKLLEVHGNFKNVICTGCRKEYPFEQVYSSLYCPICGARIRPKIALYGDEVIPEYNIAMKQLDLCSTVIIIGTSYKTNFADQFRVAAKEKKKTILEFNKNADEQLEEYLCDLEFSVGNGFF